MGGGWQTLIWVGILGVLILPLRVIHEVNPDWPLLNWLYCVSVIVFTLATTWAVGGKAWLKHFWFAIAFVLVAVRWPSRIESTIVQGMMRGAAMLTVEVLDLVGIPAITHGNLIEIDTGVVGVDEACSGIRSLQSTLMGALFLGELYKLTWRNRAKLVGYGVALAFAFNCVRTTFLTWNAAISGMGAVDKWHDSAGLTILVATLTTVWFLAVQMVTPGSTPGEVPPRAAMTVLPRGATALVVLITLFTLGGTQIWYRVVTAKTSRNLQWRIQEPAGQAAVQRLELKEKERTALGANQDFGMRWTEPDGTDVIAWWFRWNEQSMVSLVKARCHRPDVCLPASGMKLVRAYPLRWYDSGLLKIPIKAYEFRGPRDNLFVFFCLWQDGTENFGWTDNLSHGGRIDAVFRQQGKVGQQTLQIMVAGPAGYAEAEAKFEKVLKNIVKVTGDPLGVQEQGSADAANGVLVLQ